MNIIFFERRFIMNKGNKEKMDLIILDYLNKLNSGEFEPGSEESKAIIEELQILTKLSEVSDDEKSKRMDYIKLGMDAASIVLPLMFYGHWMNKGMKFEETGTFTSKTFTNFLNRMNPTKIG